MGGDRHVGPVGEAQRAGQQVAGLEGLKDGLVVVEILAGNDRGRAAVPLRADEARLAAHRVHTLKNLGVPAARRVGVDVEAVDEDEVFPVGEAVGVVRRLAGAGRQAWSRRRDVVAASKGGVFVHLIGQIDMPEHLLDRADFEVQRHLGDFDSTFLHDEPKRRGGVGAAFDEDDALVGLVLNLGQERRVEGHAGRRDLLSRRGTGRLRERWAKPGAQDFVLIVECPGALFVGQILLRKIGIDEVQCAVGLLELVGDTGRRMGQHGQELLYIQIDREEVHQVADRVHRCITIVGLVGRLAGHVVTRRRALVIIVIDPNKFQ